MAGCVGFQICVGIICRRLWYMFTHSELLHLSLIVPHIIVLLMRKSRCIVVFNERGKQLSFLIFCQSLTVDHFFFDEPGSKFLFHVIHIRFIYDAVLPPLGRHCSFFPSLFISLSLFSFTTSATPSALVSFFLLFVALAMRTMTVMTVPVIIRPVASR